jgi:hypothetical protein
MRQAKVCKWCLGITWTFWAHTMGNWGDRKFWICEECSNESHGLCE